MIKRIPILSSDFKVIYQDGEGWIEYNRYINLAEAEKKAEERQAEKDKGKGEKEKDEEKKK